MEKFAQLDMLDITMILYEFLGETKPSVSKKIILFRISNYAVLVLVLGSLFLNFFYVQGEYYIKALQQFISILQVLLKYILLTTQTAAIQNVLDKILTKFWNYRCFSKNVRTATAKFHKTVRYVQIAMLATGVMALFSYLLKPVILSNAVLPFEGYIPESDFMFAIIASSQFYCLWLSIVAVTAYDFVYIACCVNIITQLRLLKWKMKDALDKYQVNPKRKLCYYIKHHQFLYSMFHEMRKIFSIMLLFHYLVTLISSCFVLLQLFLRNMDAVSYSTQIASIGFFIAQFGLYTFPAEEVTFEFVDVPNAIYTSKWYMHDVEIQKLILSVIVKSQQQKYFSGAGLVDINVETFDSLLRKALSFCAVFNNLLKN